MELLLFYPALTQFSCADCQQFVYDVDWANGCVGTGKRKTYRAGTRDVTRTAATPPPCAFDKTACPKGSPAEEQEHLLSADNAQAWQLYREVKATNGACLSEEMKGDALLMRNLSLLDQLAEARDRQQLGREIAGQVARFLVR